MRNQPTTAGLVAALLLAAGCATGGHHGPAGRRAQPEPTISVTGVGRAAVRPDTAIATVGVEARAPRLADASADVARRMTAVLQQVKALGVADRDVTTVAYTVEPLIAQRRAEEDPVRIVGYRASNAARITVRALDQVGRVLDAAVAAGANTLRGLHFTVDDPTRAEADARARAVQNAATRARELAAAAGVQLGPLLLLTEGAQPPQPLYDRLQARPLSTAIAPGPIESGDQEITITVEAHYRIAP
jgi:uncharacterized protein YggE